MKTEIKNYFHIKRVVLCAVFLFQIHFIVGQQFPSKQLGLKDNLAQDLYRVVQDEKGYMWILSSNGIIKYNGKDFKHFGIQNGLSDEDVFNFVPDKQGRNWLINNANDLMYLRNDSIYQLPFKSSMRIYAIGKDNENIVFTNRRKTFLIDSNDSIKEIDFLPYIKSFLDTSLMNYPFKDLREIRNYPNGKFLLNSRTQYTHLPYQNLSKLYNKRDELDALQKELLIQKILKLNSYRPVVQDCVYDNNIQFFTEGNHFVFDTAFNVLNVVKFINPQNNFIKSVLKDRNGDYWLVSNDIIDIVDKNIIENEIAWLPNTQNINVLDIEIFEDELIMQSSDNTIYQYKEDTELHVLYEKTRDVSNQSNIKFLLYGNDFYIMEPSGAVIKNALDIDAYKNINLIKKSILDLRERRLKKIKKISDTQLGYLSRFSVGYYDFEFKEKKILSKGLRTGISYKGGVYYIAGLDTLHVHSGQHKINKIPLKNIKNVYAVTNEKCLVSTKLQETYICDGGSCEIVNELKDKQVQHIFIADGFYWILYNTGFIKAEVNSANGFTFIKDFELAHILKFNWINDLIINEDQVYVATDRGVFKFNHERYAFISDQFPAFIEQIVTDNQSFDFKSFIELPYEERDITFYCSALSYMDEDPIHYDYVLKGDKEYYSHSTNGEVSYTNLSPGVYEFNLKATNENGSESEVVHMKICIQKPWWQKWWFYIACFFIFLFLIYILTKVRINAIQAKAKVEQKFAELELNALQSQMNPHFVFNSMSSMQNLIQQKEFAKSDMYLAKFSRLMRMYLESSKKKYNSIQQEMEIIETYFLLEKLRFQDKISLEIENDLSSKQMERMIPSSILQPFVENAINHGLFHKKGIGNVLVRLYTKGKFICIEIEDNGIGREASQRLKSNSIQHESRAIGIIDDKIKAIKKMDNYSIEYEIIDLFNEYEVPNGTRVVILIKNTNHG